MAKEEADKYPPPGSKEDAWMMSHGDSREQRGTGNQRAGGEIYRLEERRRAADKRGQEKAADRGQTLKNNRRLQRSGLPPL